GRKHSLSWRWLRGRRGRCCRCVGPACGVQFVRLEVRRGETRLGGDGPLSEPLARAALCRPFSPRPAGRRPRCAALVAPPQLECTPNPRGAPRRRVSHSGEQSHLGNRTRLAASAPSGLALLPSMSPGSEVTLVFLRTAKRMPKPGMHRGTHIY